MIKTVPMYIAVCDRCGKECNYGDDYYAWAEEDQAVESAIDSEWLRLDSGRLVCPDCWTWSDDENEQIEMPSPQTSSPPVTATPGGEEAP